MAFQIYLTDYDRMPPGGHDQGYQTAFDAWAGDEGLQVRESGATPSCAGR